MASISLTEFADTLNDLMPDIARAFIRRQSDELFKGKITVPQFFILNGLKKGEMKMSDIARSLNVTTAAATGIVDRMVKLGYCRRIADPGDRRVIKIRIAERGLELVKKIIAQRRAMIIETFGKISQQEREDYLRILMRIREVISIPA